MSTSPTNILSPSSWMSSPVYKILAGPSGSTKSFNIHSGLLSYHSPYLRALLSAPGRWEENMSRSIIWHDWESDTVAQFIEFLYSGDYTWPNISEHSPDVTPFRNNTYGISVDTIAYRVSQMLKDENMQLSPQESASLKSHRAAYGYLKIESTDLQASITPLLHSHASLYTLALYTQVTPLATLALCHFTTTLFNIHGPLRSYVSSIVSIVRYVYANTPSLSKIDPMRAQVVRYCAENHTRFVGSAVDDLVQEGGDFAIDYLNLVLQMLKKKESNTASIELEECRKEKRELERQLLSERSAVKRLTNRTTASGVGARGLNGRHGASPSRVNGRERVNRRLFD